MKFRENIYYTKMIKFDIDKHKYSNGEKVYTSVTTLIKKFKQPFDSVTISEKYALKHPEKTAKQWRDEWSRISTESAEYGTKIHKELEQNTLLSPLCKVAAVSLDANTIGSLDTLRNLEDGIYPELMIWSDKYQLAGQADLVTIKDGIVDIADYKTYKRVDLKSFYNPKTKKYTCMLEPLNGLHDCNYNHAGLQMSLYGLILEELGYKIGRLSMIHIDRNGNKVPYSIPYSQFKMFVNFMLLQEMYNGSK